MNPSARLRQTRQTSTGSTSVPFPPRNLTGCSRTKGISSISCSAVEHYKFQIPFVDRPGFELMIPFDFHCPTRIIFGPGKLNELGALASVLGAKRVLVVSDRGIAKAGHTSRGIRSLEQNGLAVALFDRIEENPTTSHVNDGLADAREFRPDVIIGL